MSAMSLHPAPRWPLVSASPSPKTSKQCQGRCHNCISHRCGSHVYMYGGQAGCRWPLCLVPCRAGPWLPSTR
jgi:hypothetical protein